MNTDIQTINQLYYLHKSKFIGLTKYSFEGGNNWKIYWCLGEIVWAESGVHPHRIWQSIFIKSCPKINLGKLDFVIPENVECNTYRLLSALVEKNIISTEQFTRFTIDIIRDTIFDLIQESNKRLPNDTVVPLSSANLVNMGINLSLAPLNTAEIIRQTEIFWSFWVHKKLTKYSLNLAPKIIHNSFALHNSLILFKTITNSSIQLPRLINGQNTLRTLSAIKLVHAYQLTVSLLRYIEEGLIELVQIPDITYDRLYQEDLQLLQN